MWTNIGCSTADDDDVDSIGSLAMPKSVKFGSLSSTKSNTQPKHHIFHLLYPMLRGVSAKVNSNHIHAYLIITNIPKDSTNIWNMIPSKRNFVSRPLSACNSFNVQPNAVVIVIIIFIRAKTKLMPITSHHPLSPILTREYGFKAYRWCYRIWFFSFALSFLFSFSFLPYLVRTIGVCVQCT